MCGREVKSLRYLSVKEICCTINTSMMILFTSKDTILLKQAYTSDKALNEILSTGLYRHNRVTHGRILQC